MSLPFRKWKPLCNTRVGFICEARLMHARIRYSSAAIFLLTSLLLLAGCNRHPSQTTQALNGANQPASTSQQPAPAGDQANNTGANSNANSAPTISNSETATTTPAQANDDSNAAPAATTNKPSAGQPQPLIVPAGTSVVVRLQQSLSSASAVPGERFEAVLDQPLVADNQVIAPVGAPVTGHVTVARRSGRFHHPGEIGLTLDSVTLGQQRVPLITSNVVARGASHKKRNWGLIGGGTGGGALIGALAGGGKGALIGGGIGAAAGTTTALLTGKKDVTFGAERRLTFRLHRDVSL
jgi:hypothetical protein